MNGLRVLIAIFLALHKSESIQRCTWQMKKLLYYGASGLVMHGTATAEGFNNFTALQKCLYDFRYNNSIPNVTAVEIVDSFWSAPDVGINLTEKFVFSIHTYPLYVLAFINSNIKYVQRNAFQSQNVQLYFHDSYIESLESHFSNDSRNSIAEFKNTTIMSIKPQAFCCGSSIRALKINGCDIFNVSAFAFDLRSSSRALINIEETVMERVSENFCGESNPQGLTEVRITRSITGSIHSQAFRGCKTVTITRGIIDTIESGAFNSSSPGQTIDLSNSNISAIESEAFSSDQPYDHVSLFNVNISFVDQCAFYSMVVQRYMRFESVFLGNVERNVSNIFCQVNVPGSFDIVNCFLGEMPDMNYSVVGLGGIDFSYNFIRDVSQDLLSSMSPTASLNLSSNPLTCDERLCWAFPPNGTAGSSPGSVKLLTSQATCEDPWYLSGTRMKDLNRQNLMCSGFCTHEVLPKKVTCIDMEYEASNEFLLPLANDVSSIVYINSSLALFQNLALQILPKLINIEFINSSLQGILPRAFYKFAGTVTFDNCTIINVHEFAFDEAANSLLEFLSCHIEVIETDAFCCGLTNIQMISFHNSKLGIIRTEAFNNISVDVIDFSDASTSQLPSHLFSSSVNVSEILFVNADIGVISPETFNSISVCDVNFTNAALHVTLPTAFSNATFNRLIFKNAFLNVIMNRAFYNLSVQNLLFDFALVGQFGQETFYLVQDLEMLSFQNSRIVTMSSASPIFYFLQSGLNVSFKGFDCSSCAGQLPAGILSETQMHRLDLASSNLSLFSDDVFSTSTGANVIDLSHNLLTGFSVTDLDNINPNTKLIFSGNPLQCRNICWATCLNRTDPLYLMLMASKGDCSDRNTFGSTTVIITVSVARFINSSGLSISSHNPPTSPCSCPAISCGTPPLVPYGNMTTPLGTTYWKTAFYTCFQGPVLNGSATRTCQANMTWSGVTPTCTAVDCGAPPLVPHGNVTALGGTKYSATATYTCVVGFLLNGTANRTCQADGTWSSVTPTCSAVDCGAPPLVPDGNVATPGGTNYSDTATYTCVVGFLLNGMANRTCQADGTWSGVTPTCTVVSCGSFPPVRYANLLIKGNGFTFGFDFGAQIYLTCLQGYVLNGTANSICQANATWSGVTPTCTAVNCGAPASPPSHGFVTTVPGATSYSDTATYTCAQGYHLYGTATRSCQANATWSGVTPTCTGTPLSPSTQLVTTHTTESITSQISAKATTVPPMKSTATIPVPNNAYISPIPSTTTNAKTSKSSSFFSLTSLAIAKTTASGTQFVSKASAKSIGTTMTSQRQSSFTFASSSGTKKQTSSVTLTSTQQTAGSTSAIQTQSSSLAPLSIFSVVITSLSPTSLAPTTPGVPTTPQSVSSTTSPKHYNPGTIPPMEAVDSRPFNITMGVLALLIIILILGFIVALDVRILYLHTKEMMSNIYGFCKRSTTRFGRQETNSVCAKNSPKVIEPRNAWVESEGANDNTTGTL